MSEFTLKLHAPDAVAWISLDEAARRSGANLQRLRTIALKKWQPDGLAEKRNNPETGQTCWFVREDADTRFAAVRSAAVETKTDIMVRNELSGDVVQLAIAQGRQRIVEELELQLQEDARALRPIGIVAVMQRFARHAGERGIKGASVPNLKRWRRLWLDSGRDIAALADNRRISKRAAAKEGYEQYFDLLKTLWLDENEPQKSVTIKMATRTARKDGWPIPDPKKARRYLERLEQENKSQVVRYRGGASAMANKVLPYIPRDKRKMAVELPDGSIEVRELRSDEIWCADHHICDTLVMYEGELIRPWLTAINDIRSNRIVGRHWSPEAPNKNNVLLAFRDAVIRGGMCLPSQWYVDNGKDFDAWMFQGQTKQQRRAAKTNLKRDLSLKDQFHKGWKRQRLKIDNDKDRAQGLMQLMGIHTIHADPHNARGKTIERFFGIFEEGFGRFTSSYCGNTPQNRPESLYERIEAGQVEDYADYIAAADDWIYRVHHAEPLTSKIDRGLTRDEVWTANRTERRMGKREDLEMLLVPIERAKVGRMGITRGGWHYHDPSLAPYIGQEVSLRIDPDNVTSIGVWTMGFKSKIAEVMCLDLAAWGNVSDAVTTEVRRRIDAISKAIKKLSAMGGTGYAAMDRSTILSRVLREQAEQAPMPPVMPPPESMRMVQTPINASSNASPPPLKRAVGSELMDLSDLGEGGLY